MTEMVLPQFGMGMADGTIIAWHKSEGDRITQGEPLCDVEAAKTTVEVAAPCGGILQRIIVPAGTNVPVNTVIALIGDKMLSSDAVAAMAPDRAPIFAPATMAASPAIPVTTGGLAARPAGRNGTDEATQIEPRARRAARIHGIDLSTVTGTGPNGRIIENDVMMRLRTVVAVAAPAIPVAADMPAPAQTHPVSPAPSLPASTGTGVQHLRMHCDARPLLLLLEQLAPYHGSVAPVAAILLKATALAHLALDNIGFRSGSGATVLIHDPARLSLSGIARQLDAASSDTSLSPPLVVEWQEEACCIEVINPDPSLPSCLSFGLQTGWGESGDSQWTMVMTINDAGLSLVGAKQLLLSLRQLLLQPTAILT